MWTGGEHREEIAFAFAEQVKRLFDVMECEWWDLFEE